MSKHKVPVTRPYYLRIELEYNEDSEIFYTSKKNITHYLNVSLSDKELTDLKAYIYRLISNQSR